MKTKVAEFSALQEGKGLCVRAEGVKLVLVKTGSAVHAVENRCPHRGAPLHNGTLEGRVLRCSRHGIAFDLDSGRALDAACSPLLRLTLAYDGDRVGLDL